MPSVEMRRSTRVFVPKAKDGEFVRVLRSGRRLWVESDDVKSNKNEDEWYAVINNNNNKCKGHEQEQQNVWHLPMEVDEKKPIPESINRVHSGERVIKNVYCRKRKRSNAERPLLPVSFDGERRKFGLHFVRRQRRKVQPFELHRNDNDDCDGDNGLLSIVIKPFCAGCCVFSGILGVILGHMTRKDIGIAELSAFLLPNPMSQVFASIGIHFFRGLPSTTTRGLCRIFGAKQLIPLFTLDFCATPLSFMHLHSIICFRSVRLSCLCWMDFCRKNESDTGIDDSCAVISDQSGQHLSNIMVSNDPKVMKAVNPSSVIGKMVVRNAQCRNGGVMTCSRSKRRHRSMRPRRARSLSLFDQQKAIGPPMSHHLAHKKNASALSSCCNPELRRSARKSGAIDNDTCIPQLSSSALSLDVEVDSRCCSANILVIETEKCYRVEGAEIMLDVSNLNEWVLAVKRDGLKRYCLKAQKEMRPCTTNRFSHSVIWTAENGWKLEFPDRKDWSVFKELYKACVERNVVPPSPVVKIIPVPGVREVTNAWDSCGATFERPDSYIRMASDELSKALSSRTANYDMDSEDEEWIRNLNTKSNASDDVSEDTFELMIDAFEKASFCNPENCKDEKAAVNLCMDLASSAVVEEAYRYWMKKRKQKNSSLLCVFQLNQPKRALLISKPVLRKKRSLKRQASQLNQRGRGKDSSVLQAIAAEQSAVDEQNAILKVEEAMTSANKTLELAINKRRRAQFLMENADLAIYRATMALRIADAAQVADTLQAAAYFLD